MKKLSFLVKKNTSEDWCCRWALDSFWCDGLEKAKLKLSEETKHSDGTLVFRYSIETTRNDFKRELHAYDSETEINSFPPTKRLLAHNPGWRRMPNSVWSFRYIYYKRACFYNNTTEFNGSEETRPNYIVVIILEQTHAYPIESVSI